jgi:PKD repeat protein
MKKVGILLFILISFINNTHAQICVNGYPRTYHSPKLKSAVKIPKTELKAVDNNALIAEDNSNQTPYRYSVFKKLSIDLKVEGIKFKSSDQKGDIWKYCIENSSAKSIQIYFSTFNIPEGADLYLYNEDYSKIFGGFTSINNNELNSLMIADFPGNKVYLEYYEPSDCQVKGELVIGMIGQGYKPLSSATDVIDTNHYIGVNCPEGKEWQDQKHSVCLYSFRNGDYGYFCSGAFINNTRNNGMPYFLTAFHCISSETSANSIVAYFNFEQINCDGDTLGKQLTLSGAKLLSTGSQSDYALVLFEIPPPASYQPYYAGWDISDQHTRSAAGIHHPNGLPKKISIAYSPFSTYDKSIKWEDNTETLPNTHWTVKFDQGETYSGSSGSPLFNNEKRITGQLHGGDNKRYFYGKLSYSWDHYNSSGSKPLYKYLDPDSTGIEAIDGYYPGQNIPDPQIYTNIYDACISAPLELTGESAFEPTSWEWSFYPASITFHDGTDKYSKNPVVSFNTAGNYNVGLTIANSAGSNTLQLNNLIHTGNNITVDLLPLNSKDTCLCSIDSLMIRATGANKFKWSLNPENTTIFTIKNDSANPVVLKKLPVEKNATANIQLTLNSSNGSCSASRSIIIPIKGQSNDSIKHASLITYGDNGPFSNSCSSKEENEPKPLYTSCTSQLGWCNEYDNGQDTVENSVWFYFIPQLTEILQLYSTGMDNQIAVYEAEKPEDMLTGNYRFLAANDNRTNNNYNPYIYKLSVIKGKTYWVQVDGSDQGKEGEFNLYLDRNGTPVDEYFLSKRELKIYPQPALDYIMMECNRFSDNKELKIEILSIDGKASYKEISLQNPENLIKLDISNLNKGMYIVRIFADGEVITTKMIK